jgi:hypothetical protein
MFTDGIIRDIVKDIVEDLLKMIYGRRGAVFSCHVPGFHPPGTSMCSALWKLSKPRSFGVL